MANLILITGCSGGGKSTLLAELARRGHHIVMEPGRRLVQASLKGMPEPTPWDAPAGFARRALELALEDIKAARDLDGPVFFDRGVVDAAIALEHSDGTPAAETLGPARHYENPVFLAPPWRDLFRNDAERRHGFEAASDEYERIQDALPGLGYRVQNLPKSAVADRADLILGMVT